LKKISASEIGTFIYCQRAWWYRQRGLPSAFPQRLELGSEQHQRHGRAVLVGIITRAAGLAALLAATILLALYLLSALG
jgi:hypothetical protein